jgi:tetratricopeptide (TPR) repeat protein
VESVTINAIEQLEENTKSNLYVNIASIYLFFCKYENAIFKCDKALEINPRNLEGIITKGQILTTIGQYSESLVWFNKAIEIDSVNVYALVNFGYTYDRLGQYEQSIVYYDKALMNNQKDAALSERRP